MTVAQAAPASPHLKTKMKSGSSAMLTPEEIAMLSMERRVLPSPRTRLLKTIIMKKAGVPRKMMPA